MRVFNRHVSMRGLTVFGFETVLISASILTAAAISGSLTHATDALWKVLLVTALCELCFYYNDLYDLTRVHGKRELAVGMLRGIGAAAIVLAAVSAIVPAILIGAGTFTTMTILLLVVVPVWRFAFDGLTDDPHLEERVLVVGAGQLACIVAQQIRQQHDFAYRVVGFVEEPELRPDAVAVAPLIGAPMELQHIIRSHRVDRIVVSLSDRRGRLPLNELLQAKLAGVRVEDAATTYERITGKILVEDLKPSWLIFSDGFRASRTTRAIKRGFDLLLAIPAMIVGLPLMLLTAIAVRLDSSGPIVYCQDRVGENGRVFTLCKFRSMRIDAEQGTPIWAKDNDDRVTRIGRVIRKARLDELPQLWNVLRGDMSFVGPRPERPFFVEQLEAAIPFYMARHAVKPGVTGWAQVKYRYGASIEDAREKLRYDLYYIKHQSLFFDFSILVDTVKVILSGKGAQ
jgi:sugar transferase (PEP-CTERM system associated)